MRHLFPSFREEIESDEQDLIIKYEYCDQYDDYVSKIFLGKVNQVAREELQIFLKKSAIQLSTDRVRLCIKQFDDFRSKLAKREVLLQTDGIRMHLLKIQGELSRRHELEAYNQRREREMVAM